MKKFMAVVAMIAVVAFAAPALAATNPFMDVPQGHWAYDAVGLLASRGIISGYPDGAYKGAQPATRYEMASLVARALVAVDADKASKQDLELLKKLVLEFKDELDALGVKVDQLDKRVAVLEENLGGWKLSGQFRFDANFGNDSDNGSNAYTDGPYDTSFEKSRLRLTLEKQIDENTSFYAQFRAGNDGSGSVQNARGDVDGFNVRQVYVDTVLPGDIQMRVGRFFYDIEDDHGLYVDNDAIFGDYRVDGFAFTKAWDTFSIKAVIGRNTEFPGDDSSYFTDDDENEEDAFGAFMMYGLDLTWQPSDNFFLGLWGTWMVEDGDLDEFSAFNADNENSAFPYGTDDLDYSTYAVYASYNFTPAIALQGMYYFQDLGDSWVDPDGGEDDPQAWKIMLILDQDLLKFTALRFEYQELDNSFVGVNDPYSFANDNGNAASISENLEYADPDGTSKYFFVLAEQEWNDKWSSYIRYAYVDFDTDDLDDATNWGIGVTYQYTPAIAFRLAFDQVDYGDNNPSGAKYDTDNVFQFRTTVNF